MTHAVAEGWFKYVQSLQAQSCGVVCVCCVCCVCCECVCAASVCRLRACVYIVVDITTSRGLI